MPDKPHMTLIAAKCGTASHGRQVGAVDPGNYDANLGMLRPRTRGEAFAFALRCDMNDQSVEDDIRGFASS